MSSPRATSVAHLILVHDREAKPGPRQPDVDRRIGRERACTDRNRDLAPALGDSQRYGGVPSAGCQFRQSCSTRSYRVEPPADKRQ
jgi:hypothetical protein